jgi:tetratricopeptide (TPR) repeat protein
VNLGRNEEALDCLNRALELEPDSAIAWLNKGDALYNLERYAEARKALTRAAALGNKSAEHTLSVMEQQGL